MIIIVGLVILVAAVVAAMAGVLANSGRASAARAMVSAFSRLLAASCPVIVATS